MSYGGGTAAGGGGGGHLAAGGGGGAAGPLPSSAPELGARVPTHPPFVSLVWPSVRPSLLHRRAAAASAGAASATTPAADTYSGYVE